ncbi:PREDICTED: uncharacterized protein LOC109211124 [Nicotiana attenuata]|uniref:uncharacterized protein LOC109211124 n=1 Tax=Nicotiana attenuata TaxID=49451 RepID=UPI0009059EEC|nr:PREDICTED: uncharacterized protein LOC109211124 [Nicotiana attenuata]
MLSKRLSKWSREEIGNINDQVSKWKAEIQLLYEIDTNSNTDNSRTEANKVYVEYIQWLSKQESLLKQKTQTKWFEDGDSNTKYFHSLLREKRRRLQLHRIKNHRGKWIQKENNIAKAAVKHFDSLFNLPKPTLNPYLFSCIPKCILEEDNMKLFAIPNENEIKDDVFNLSADSTTGPDGYNGTFFRHYWDIIKHDIVDFVREFFNGKRLTKFYSHTCLALIPKINAPANFFRIRAYQPFQFYQ